jgi:SSS family solute:Na+ symporter
MAVKVQLVIILVYFAVLIVIGWLARRFSKTSTDFLIAGRNLGLALCTVSILGEWLGGMSTIGTAEKAYVNGFFPMWYNISTATGMVLFGLFLAARYRGSNVHTVGEMLEKLYDRRVRIVTSFCFVAAFIILSYIQLQAVGGVAAQVLGVDYTTAVIVSGLLVTAYVYFGGMRSIALTNLIHVLLLYSSLLAVYGLILVRLGGYANLFARLPAAEVSRLRNPFSMGWGQVLAWMLGGILAGFASQASIQPVFAARDIRTAKRASYLSAVFIAPVGIIVSTLALSVRAGAAGGLPPTARETLPFLLMNSPLLPGWLSGLAMAGIVAAILSTIAPVMFAVSTIITKDIYQLLFNTRADDRRVFIMSKRFVIVIGLLAIPLAVFLKGRILDSAYITYAIRGAAALGVLLGIFWLREGRPLPTPRSIAAAMVVSTLASIAFAVFKREIGALLGFSVDKVYAAIFSALSCILVITALERRRS